jgi:hypothetical protein
VASPAPRARNEASRSGAELLREVRKLDPDDLRQLLGLLADSPQVEAAGYRVAERKPRGKRNVERDARIMEMSGRNLCAGQIANIEGMERDAVHKVIQRARK